MKTAILTIGAWVFNTLAMTGLVAVIALDFSILDVWK